MAGQSAALAGDAGAAIAEGAGDVVDGAGELADDVVDSAKEMVADILKDAEQITLKNMERGKYFRIAADVLVDGEDLGDILVDAGVAIRYDGGKKNNKWCK